MEKEKIEDLIKAIEKKKEEAAVIRDELRELVDDLEAIVTSLDEAMDGIDDGVNGFKRSLDTMSEYLFRVIRAIVNEV